MIRYIELAPNPDITFQSGKITRVLVNEGDSVDVGDKLFIVDAQGKEAEVLSSKAGRVNELIVEKDDVIHKLSSLLVLETIVADTPAAPKDPVTEPSVPQPTAPAPQAEVKQDEDKASTAKSTPRTKRRAKAKQTKGDADAQATLDFGGATNHSSSESTQTQDHKNIMSEIKVPDLGGADAVEVIDILVNVGDTVNVDDPLMTVESDKASMDIPAEATGTITEIVIAVGDNVSEGDVIFKIDGAGEANSTAPETPAAPSQPAPEPEAPAASTSDNASEIKVIIPDLGGAADVDVIEILVSVGDTIEAEQALITVESDKASMDVPSSHAGTVTSIAVNTGDKVNEGDHIITISGSATAPATQTTNTEPAAPAEPKATPQAAPAKPAAAAPIQQAASKPSGPSHASPSVRRLARELGVDLASVVGTARKNRISKDDVKAFVKGILAGGAASAPAASGGAGIPEIPAQDFSKFGEIELQPLNKIKRVTAQHLHRSWLNIPHVTHHDETNIQSLEEFRKTLNEEYAKQNKGIKLSPLAFVVKAVVNALQNYPQFNSSLENGGNNLIMKKYFHIGIAVETPNGLVVPVIRDADTLSVAEIAVAMGDLAKKARDGKLKPNEMQGGTFSISSLGGIGGTSFTPLVNAPEVAILGVSRTKIQPVWNGSEFEPAPMLPLSLSYDHRVIDGAEAARFTRHIAAALEDIRRLTV